MQSKNTMQLLQSWYASQCNGEWEHTCGVRIVTSDNPAWNVTISLVGTSAEGKNIPPFRSPDYSKNDEDWVDCRLSDDGNEFWGVGDQHKLEFIIQYFLKYASAKS